MFQTGIGFIHRVSDAGIRRIKTDVRHGVSKLIAILGQIDGFWSGANQLNRILVQHTVMVEIECAVQPGLPAHGWQYGVGSLAFNDALNQLPVNRLDVDGICSCRVSHDGRRIGVNQYNAITLFAQRLASLRT